MLRRSGIVVAEGRNADVTSELLGQGQVGEQRHRWSVPPGVICTARGATETRMERYIITEHKEGSGSLVRLDRERSCAAIVPK